MTTSTPELTQTPQGPSIIDTNISESMQANYIDYAMSVITDRALPDVRDGFKPVHRRILHAMQESANIYSKPYRKSARMVGDVIGKYHPHGDVSVYDAGVRMAQPFTMNHMLIDGQGNFGSVDGDRPAAMRYTEMRMTRLATEFFNDIGKETVAFQPNYDGSEKEPVVIPVPAPNLVINGGEGIAVGMACTVAPHNMREVIAATLHLLQARDPNAVTSAELMAFMKGPDFPTGALVHALDGFAEAMESGRGRVKIRAKWHEEDRGRLRKSIVLDELPYQVNKAKLVSAIAALVNEKAIEGIVDLSDESSKDGMRVRIDVARDASTEAVFAELCAKTEVETTVSYNCTVLVNGVPRLIGVRQMLVEWIRFRQEVVLKRHIYERKQALARMHVLEAFIKALALLDQVIATIRAASSPADARRDLMALLVVDEGQAQAILDLKLQRLTGMELESIRAEHAAVAAEILRLSEVIDTPALIDEVIGRELADCSKRFGRERQTELGYGISEITREDMIPRQEVILVVTKDGYVKRMPLSTFNRQNRGTRGKRAMDLDAGDAIVMLKQVHSHDSLLLFDSAGKSFAVKAYGIPEQGPASKGRHIKNVIEGLDKGVTGMVMVPDHDDKLTVLTISRMGLVKRSKVDDYEGASRKGGIFGVGINSGDQLAGIHVVSETDHIVLVANSGKSIRFEVADVRVSGRTSIGVRGILLEGDEFVVGSMIVPGGQSEGLHLLCVGDQGIGKRTLLSEFMVQNRGGKGVMGFKATKKTGNLVAAMGATEQQDLMLLTSNGVTNKVAVADVSVQGRATSGVILMNVDARQRIVSVSAAVKLVDEDDLAPDGVDPAQQPGV